MKICDPSNLKRRTSSKKTDFFKKKIQIRANWANGPVKMMKTPPRDRRKKTGKRTSRSPFQVFNDSPSVKPSSAKRGKNNRSPCEFKSRNGRSLLAQLTNCRKSEAPAVNSFFSYYYCFIMFPPGGNFVCFILFYFVYLACCLVFVFFNSFGDIFVCFCFVSLALSYCFLLNIFFSLFVVFTGGNALIVRGLEVQAFARTTEKC